MILLQRLLIPAKEMQSVCLGVSRLIRSWKIVKKHTSTRLARNKIVNKTISTEFSGWSITTYRNCLRRLELTQYGIVIDGLKIMMVSVPSIMTE